MVFGDRVGLGPDFGVQALGGHPLLERGQRRGGWDCRVAAQEVEQPGDLELGCEREVESPAGVEHLAQQLGAAVLDVAQVGGLLAPGQVALERGGQIHADEARTQEREVVNAELARRAHRAGVGAAWAAGAASLCQLHKGE